MAKLEFFAGESVLIFDVSDERLNWTKVYARSKSDYLRLGAMDFETIRKRMLLKLLPPYSPKKAVVSGIEYNMFGLFNLMDTHAGVLVEPYDDGSLKLLWNSASHPHFTHII